MSAAGLLTAAALGGCARRPDPVDVVVIGAGLAGLNAAYLLESAGYKVRVVEATKRIGGRVFTADDRLVPGHPELGASGIGAHYARLIAAAQRVRVPLVKERARTEPVPGDMIYALGDRLIRPDDWPEDPFNQIGPAELRRLPLHIMQFALYSSEENPFPRGDLTAWQSGDHRAQDISVRDYLRAKGLSDQMIKLGASTNNSYGTDASDLSMLMGWQSANLIRSFYQGPNALPSQPLAARGGNQRLPEAMAAALKNEVVLRQPVAAIVSDKQGVEIHTENGDVHRCRYAICTMPFSALRRIKVRPNLAGPQSDAVANLGYTPVFQAHFLPTRPFWEEDGLPPSMWTDRSPGRFLALRNDPGAPKTVTSFLAFVNGTIAVGLDQMSPEAAGRRILDDLATLRPASRGALRPLTTWTWISNPYAGGSYAHWKPGQISTFARVMRAPAGRLHFAGEHTAEINRGMEGAMESGERAAFEVMDLLG